MNNENSKLNGKNPVLKALNKSPVTKDARSDQRHEPANSTPSKEIIRAWDMKTEEVLTKEISICRAISTKCEAELENHQLSVLRRTDTTNPTGAAVEMVAPVSRILSAALFP